MLASLGRMVQQHAPLACLAPSILVTQYLSAISIYIGTQYLLAPWYRTNGDLFGRSQTLVSSSTVSVVVKSEFLDCFVTRNHERV